MKYFKILSIAAFTLFSLTIYGENTGEDKTLSVSSSIVIDNVSNLSGGIEAGNTTLGLFDFGVVYKPFQNGLFQNTTFHMHLLKTNGKGSSEYFIGDAQVASNIEGKASRFIYELILSQQLGDLLLSFGLHDLNTEFMMSDYAGDFINSSFGIFPAVSMNVPVSIFPVTSVGGILSYNKKMFDIVGGIYNLNNEYVEEEEFELHNHTFQKGYMGVAELRYRLNPGKKLSGEYKFGGYYKDCAPCEEVEEVEAFIVNKNHGVYFIADQSLYTVNNKFNLGLFTQVGLTPKKTNYVPDYYGFGLSVRTEGRKYAPDFIGLALGRVGLNNYSAELGFNNPEHETVIELSAKKTFYNRITLQPDIQYIMHPSGMYNDAIVGMVRLQIEFNN